MLFFLNEYVFYLEKQTFWDSIYLRYNIPLRNLPSKCVYGYNFTIVTSQRSSYPQGCLSGASAC